MDISKLIDEIEQKWEKDAEEKMAKIVERIEEMVNQDLYELAHQTSSIATFNHFIIFLLENFKDVLYKALDDAFVDTTQFEREVIVSFILSITRNRSNVEFLGNILKKCQIISSYEEKENRFIISTKFGEITFQKLENVLNDKELYQFIEKNEDITSSCHESTLFLLQRNPKYIAVTSICHKNLYKKYFHSFILDGDYVIDLTSNLYMKKEEYYQLYEVIEIHRVNYQEFVSEEGESKQSDFSHTLFPLLRNAVYQEKEKIGEFINGRSKK